MKRVSKDDSIKIIITAYCEELFDGSMRALKEYEEDLSRDGCRESAKWNQGCSDALFTVCEELQELFGVSIRTVAKDRKQIRRG